MIAPRLVWLPDARTALGRDQVALVPGQAAPSLPLDLPEGLTGAARDRVALRQAHDTLGSSGHVQVHPLKPARTSDWSRVVVMARDDLESWRQRAGSSCAAILPDYLALPFAPGLWCVAMRGGTVVMRHGLDAGFSAEPELAALLISKLSGQDPAPDAVLREEALPAIVETALRALDIHILGSRDEAARRKLASPVVLGHGELDFDLRRDAGAARQRMRRALLPWICAAGIAVAAAIVWASALTRDAQRIEQRLADSRRQTEALVRAEFVPTGPILDPRLQVTRRLTDLRAAAAATGTAGGDPLALLGDTLSVLAQGALTLRTVSIRGDGTLSADLTLADFAALDATIAALGDAGFAATPQGAGLGPEGGVDATLTIKGDAP